MNLGDVRNVFGIATLVCVFGVVLNLLMIKKRGVSAMLLAGAFLCLGIAALSYSQGLSPFLYGSFGVLVVLLLIADFMVRMGKLGGQG